MAGLLLPEAGAATATTRGEATKSASSTAPAPAFDVFDNLWESVELRAKYRKILGKFASGAPTVEVSALFIEQLELKQLYAAKKLDLAEITIGFEASLAEPEPEPEPETEPETTAESSEEATSPPPPASPSAGDEPHPVPFKDVS